MDKVSFWHFYLGHPIVASFIVIFILSLFLVIYGHYVSENTSKHNAFLSFVKNDEFIIGIAILVSAVVSVLSAIIMAANHRDQEIVLAYPEHYINISYGIYSLIPIVILLLRIQPRFSEKLYVKRQRVRLISETINSVEQYIIAVGAYKTGYKGLTLNTLSPIITSFDILKSKLVNESQIKCRNLKTLYESIERIENLSNEVSNLLFDFKAIQEKEQVVLKFINDLEYNVKFQKVSNNESKSQLEYLENLVPIDFLKAYDFVNSLKKNKVYNQSFSSNIRG